jgi:Tol biopolymer transport system component
MNKCGWSVIVFAAASLCLAQSPSPAAGQELSAEAKSKEAADVRAKRNARAFENFATTINLYDRSGKLAGKVGERAMYDDTVLSPDRTRIAVVKEDLENESADLFVVDVATGKSTRLTTSIRTEFITAPVWSPDGSRIAYATILKGQEGIYARAANGQGEAELLYKNPGAFLNLADWSLDGRFLSFVVGSFDLSGATLYILPLQGNPEHKAIEVFRSNLRMFGPRFSPDGRFLSYTVIDTANKPEIFVRPVESSVSAGPWQISQGTSFGSAFWKRDGKELYYVALDRSVMVSEVTTIRGFTFTKPKPLFRPPGGVPDRVSFISLDGERFLALPPPRGQQLQQITIFNRQGQVVKKVGEPGLYFGPAFSPDGTRLLVMKEDLKSGQRDLWTIDIDTGKGTQLTNDTLPRMSPLWSPDGKNILYASFRDGDFPLYRKAADGTGGEELLFRYTHGAGVGLTDISWDGKFLICDSGGVILAVPLAGSDPLARKAVEYLRDEYEAFVGRLSPDGRFMAFRSTGAGKDPQRFEVYVQPFDASTAAPGEGKWQVSKDGVQAMIHWRSDGQEIFFRGQDLNSNDLVVMAVDVTTTPSFSVGTPRVLFRLPGPLNGNLGNISRDGQRFAFAINVPADNREH